VIGGLITSTLITLFVVPVFYLLLQQLSEQIVSTRRRRERS
jgi:Cu/Ag efflux pump CusA